MASPTVETGYTLQGVYAIDQHYEALDPEDVEEERKSEISWDWRVDEEGSFTVYLEMRIQGPKAVPMRVRVGYVALFECSGEPQTLDVKNFVVYSASALLIPYLRHAISSLTAAGPHGPLEMSPINVRALLDFVDFEESTGFKQMQENPELAVSLGFEEGQAERPARAAEPTDNDDE